MVQKTYSRSTYRPPNRRQLARPDPLVDVQNQILSQFNAAMGSKNEQFLRCCTQLVSLPPLIGSEKRLGICDELVDDGKCILFPMKVNQEIEVCSDSRREIAAESPSLPLITARINSTETPLPPLRSNASKICRTAQRLHT